MLLRNYSKIYNKPFII